MINLFILIFNEILFELQFNVNFFDTQQIAGSWLPVPRRHGVWYGDGANFQSNL